MKNLIISIIFLAVLSLCSCGSSSDDHMEIKDESHLENNIHQEQAKKIFNSIPDPAVLTKIITDAQLEYRFDILNDPMKYASYNLEQDKALNLGVYGTDLSYASMFEQTQECLTYLKSVNQLCKSLGINGVFDENTSDRIEANKSNRDSLLTIISGSFAQADEYLTKNKRGNFSTLIIIGGWIEGMYIACNLTLDSKNEQAANELAKHGETLISIIKLIESYESATTEVEKLKTDLKILEPFFNELNKPNMTLDSKISAINQLNIKLIEVRKSIIK